MSETTRTTAEWAKLDREAMDADEVISGLRAFGEQLERDLAAAVARAEKAEADLCRYADGDIVTQRSFNSIREQAEGYRDAMNRYRDELERQAQMREKAEAERDIANYLKAEAKAERDAARAALCEAYDDRLEPRGTWRTCDCDVCQLRRAAAGVAEPATATQKEVGP